MCAVLQKRGAGISVDFVAPVWVTLFVFLLLPHPEHSLVDSFGPGASADTDSLVGTDLCLDDPDIAAAARFSAAHCLVVVETGEQSQATLPRNSRAAERLSQEEEVWIVRWVEIAREIQTVAAFRRA